MPLPTTLQQRNEAVAEPSTVGPIMCRCPRWRRGLLGDHRNWRAEYERARLAGIVPDEYMFSAIYTESRLESAELAR
jgi:hypothetical protein